MYFSYRRNREIENFIEKILSIIRNSISFFFFSILGRNKYF